MQEQTTVGRMIATAISDAGISKVEAAERLGCSRQTLDHWIRDYSAPDLDRLKALVDFTGRSQEDVLTAILRGNGLEVAVASVRSSDPGWLKGMEPLFVDLAAA